MMKLKQLPVTVEAAKWDGKNISELQSLTIGSPTNKRVSLGPCKKVVILHTVYGNSMIYIGDFLVKDPSGDVQVCNRELAPKLYGAVA